jgi:hypothetical protein
VALCAVLLLAGSALADQFRFVAKHRGDARFAIQLCIGDGGRIVAILHRPDGRLICGPIDVDRLPDRVLSFRCRTRGRDLLLFIFRTPDGLVWKLQRGDECVTGPLCPVP